jgi:hypothetical protein
VDLFDSRWKFVAILCEFSIVLYLQVPIVEGGFVILQILDCGLLNILKDRQYEG